MFEKKNSVKIPSIPKEKVDAGYLVLLKSIEDESGFKNRDFAGARSTRQFH